MASHPLAASPTSATERLQSLDILRGLALFGMIVVHFHDHSLEVGGFNDLIRTLIWRFVESKSHGTFALLFGAGFAIQMLRAEARGTMFARIYLRRLAVLAMFGFVAHAGFGFNVLLGYAVWGVPLLLIRRWSTRALLVTAALSAMSVSLFIVLTTWYDLVTLGPDGTLAAAQTAGAYGADVNAALRAAAAQDSYGVLFLARLKHMAWFYTRPFSFMPGGTLTLFIMGLLAVREGIFESPWAHRRVIVAMMGIGISSWAIDNWLLGLWTAPIGFPVISRQVHYLFGLVRDQWLTFTYVGAALLLFARKPAWLERLRSIGLAGRMALTNYLLQIMLLDFMFSGYALHLSYIKPVWGPPLALLVFCIEVAISRAWLARYRFGPAEWVWRSLTYGQVQTLTRPDL